MVFLKKFDHQIFAHFGVLMNDKIIMRRTYILYVLAFFCVFFLLFNIQIVTPIQSDDYRYLSMAGSIDKLYHHYISWSGRISADVTSSSLLYFFSKGWYSALNSLSLTLLIFMISYLPELLSNLVYGVGQAALLSDSSSTFTPSLNFTLFATNVSSANPLSRFHFFWATSSSL